MKSDSLMIWESGLMEFGFNLEVRSQDDYLMIKIIEN